MGILMMDEEHPPGGPQPEYGGWVPQICVAAALLLILAAIDIPLTTSPSAPARGSLPDAGRAAAAAGGDAMPAEPGIAPGAEQAAGADSGASLPEGRAKPGGAGALRPATAVVSGPGSCRRRRARGRQRKARAGRTTTPRRL